MFTPHNFRTLLQRVPRVLGGLSRRAQRLLGAPLQGGGRGFESLNAHNGGFVEFADFSSRNRPGFCRSRSEGLNPSRWLPGEGPSRFVVVAKRTVLGWCFHSECFGPYVLCSWLGCWRQVALVPMVNKDLRDLQAPMVSKDLRVRRGLRDRVARRMVRHARMRPALLEPWFQVPTPQVCSLRTA